jgi:putative ABC transport system permease protein
MVWAASVRHLWRHPAQLLLALVGLALGVATITAVDIATASSQRAFELSLAAVSGPATHEITGGPTGIDEELFAELSAASVGLALTPVVEGYVTVADQTLQLMGIDVFSATRFRGETAAALGGLERDPLGFLSRWLTQPGAVTLDAATAAQLGLSVDHAFELDVVGRSFRAVPIEIEPAQAGHESLLLTDIAQAQEWLGLVGRLSRIEVQAPSGSAAALAQLAARLPAGVSLVPAGQGSRTSSDMTAAFTANLRAMSLLALLVGLFLIYGAISFAVLQRRKTLGVLRALGVTPGAVLGLVLAEAAVLGIVGAAIGVVAGALIGRTLVALVARTINDLYFVVSVATVALPAGDLAKAVAAGVGAALLAAALPALEAARSAPQLGLRRITLESRAVRIARWLVPASVLLAAAAGAIVLLSRRSLFAGFVALFLLLLSVAALTPALLRASARWAARISAGRSPVARLAFADVAASLSRTGVAVASLGMALAAMIGVSVMVASFRQSLLDWLGRTMRADVYVTAPGPGFARPERRLEPEVVAALVRVPGVVHYSSGRRVVVDSARGPVALDAVELAPESHQGYQLPGGPSVQTWSQFERGAILMAEPLAYRLQLAVGGQLMLATAQGMRPFPIAGIYREYGNDRGAVLMSRATYRRFWGDDAVSSLGLFLAPGVLPARIIPALLAAARGRQALFIGSNADVRALSISIFERTFVITRVLYYLAAGVAAIGLVSALLGWELERARDLAIVRALGLTPRAAAGLIEAQTLFMGLIALLAALPAGLLTALLLVMVVNRRAFGWQLDFHLRAAQLGSALLLALGAALIAGLYPAWRSARTPLAADIREE